MNIKVEDKEFLEFLMKAAKNSAADIDGDIIQLPCGMFFVNVFDGVAYSADLNAAVTITSKDFSCTRKCC